MVREPYFMLTPFWRSKLFNSATGQKDFTRRGIIGFVRSSPLYAYNKCSVVAEAYFNGKFPESFERHLLTPEITESSTIENILNESHVLQRLPVSFRNNFVDVLLAYIHSPLQTRKARQPMKDPAAQVVFDKLLNVIPLFYFVQEVFVHSPPKRMLVSIIY